LKNRHDDDKRRDNNNITISQIPATRSGKMDYNLGHEQQGQYAGIIGAFSAHNNKCKAECPAIRLPTSEQEEAWPQPPQWCRRGR
jgi:hypothetical protein